MLVVLSVICRHEQVLNSQKCESLTFPAEVEQGCALPSGLSSYTVNKCPFHGLFSTMFSPFLYFLLLVLLFKMVPKCSAEVPSNVLRRL